MTRVMRPAGLVGSAMLQNMTTGGFAGDVGGQLVDPVQYRALAVGQRSVFGQQWGCCPPLFGECVDDEIVTLFQGMDAVEPALRWFGFRRAHKKSVKRAYLTYVAP
ncbi:MAG: hypothetical protein KDE54_12165, partial [Caldilineaceae bacterium]|nr:hypothetical protein [Caldilineaceae bacterium]MCB0142841.1 hypothetical protein [Caldilineaceae bacterium]